MSDPRTDNLRTRIAAVLNANLPVMEFLRPGDTEYAADAVIRELGQRRCERCRSHRASATITPGSRL